MKIYYLNNNNQNSYSNYDKIVFNSVTKALTVYYKDYGRPNREKADLFAFMDKYQVIDAFELGNCELIYLEKIYKFKTVHEQILIHSGRVTLRYIDDLKSYASLTKDKDFIYKYYKRIYKDNLDH